MTMNFESFSHPHHADWETGRQDGCEFNPISRPGDRTGDALAAYLAGFESGRDDLGAYYDQEDA